MNKLSADILALAEQVLARPTEQSSREAIAAALLLAQVAWNRAADPFGGDQAGHYRKGLDSIKQFKADCLQELKSADYEALIQELVQLKLVRYPTDDRIIHVCGLTPENNVRVEWRPAAPHREN